MGAEGWVAGGLTFHPRDEPSAQCSSAPPASKASPYTSSAFYRYRRRRLRLEGPGHQFQLLLIQAPQGEPVLRVSGSSCVLSLLPSRLQLVTSSSFQLQPPLTSLSQSRPLSLEWCAVSPFGPSLLRLGGGGGASVEGDGGLEDSVAPSQSSPSLSWRASSQVTESARSGKMLSSVWTGCGWGVVAGWGRSSYGDEAFPEHV